MSTEYPHRPMIPQWARYACMIFGLGTIVGGVVNAALGHASLVLGSIVVGGIWFAFGNYGGLPLVNTVESWHPSPSQDAVEEMHRQGLLVMRRRKWSLGLRYQLLWPLAVRALHFRPGLLPTSFFS